jgi:hypothetical protein
VSARPQSRPQRKGTKTSYLTPVSMPKLDLEERDARALAAWGSEAALDRLSASVVVTVLQRGVQRDLTLHQLALADLMELQAPVTTATVP